MQRTPGSTPGRVLACLLLPMLTLACAQGGDEEAEPVSTAVATPEANTAKAPPLSRSDPQIDEILAQMTLQEKVGQMTQPNKDYLVEPSDIATYFLGSVLSGGDADPPGSNSAKDWLEMVEGFEAHAQNTRLKIPLLYGVDAVHGHSNVVGAVIFPHNIGLGATRDADLVERIGRATAAEMIATSIPWTFAPAVTVPRDERWGRTYEGFSEEPQVAGELGAATVRGLQGTDLAAPETVAACAKHFAGDGGTVFGTGLINEEGTKFPLDRGDVQLDEGELRRLHVASYLESIEAGVATIMPSYSSWNGLKCSGNKWLLTDLLKEELGFEGFLISDWAALDEIEGDDYASQVEQSINAGMDMVMVPDKYREFFDTLVALVEDERVPMERIDDAVRRILRVKFALGMMEEGYDHTVDPTLLDGIGRAEHRELAREAVQKSLVLLRNEGALPLSRDAKRIHVAGKSADDVGNLCGGWTVKWQGESGPVTVGTTVLEGIRQLAGENTEITFSVDGSGAEGADVAVVVIGETPYAEMVGDRDDLTLSAEDAATIARIAENGIPVVTVLVSGRPLILGDTLEQSSALVAAWLPGTEGQGVADVLFGDAPFSGKLSFTWPRSMDQLPINVGDDPYDPLFPFGYGLTY